MESGCTPACWSLQHCLTGSFERWLGACSQARGTLSSRIRALRFRRVNGEAPARALPQAWASNAGLVGGPVGRAGSARTCQEDPSRRRIGMRRPSVESMGRAFACVAPTHDDLRIPS
jgi:hypothetical protein